LHRYSEGPNGLILCPSRELARQTHEVIEGFTVELAKQGMSEMRIMVGLSLITSGCQSGCVDHTGCCGCVMSDGRFAVLGGLSLRNSVPTSSCEALSSIEACFDCKIT
jgi:hypothetical protein